MAKNGMDARKGEAKRDFDRATDPNFVRKDVAMQPEKKSPAGPRPELKPTWAKGSGPRPVVQQTSGQPESPSATPQRESLKAAFDKAKKKAQAKQQLNRKAKLP